MDNVLSARLDWSNVILTDAAGSGIDSTTMTISTVLNLASDSPNSACSDEALTGLVEGLPQVTAGTRCFSFE